MLLAIVSTFHGMVQYNSINNNNNNRVVVVDHSSSSISSNRANSHDKVAASSGGASSVVLDASYLLTDKRLSRATSPRTNYANFILLAASSAATSSSSRMKIINSNRIKFSLLRALVRWAQLLIVFILLAVLLVFCFGFLPTEWRTLQLIQSLRSSNTATDDDAAAIAAAAAAAVKKINNNGKVDIAAGLRGMPLCQRPDPELFSTNAVANEEKHRSPRALNTAPSPAAAAAAAATSTLPYRHPLIAHFIRMVVSGGDEFSEVEPSGLIITTWELNRIQYASILSTWKALLAAREYDRNFRKNTPTKDSKSTTSRAAGHSADDDDDNEPVIYLHSNIQPEGKYYELLRTKHGVNVRWNYAERKKSFSNRWIRYLEHEADFHKLNATYTFGGIHADFDVLIVNGTRLREMQYEGECVVAVDVNLRMNDIVSQEIRHGQDCLLNSGLLSCAKHSPLLRIWRDSYACDYRTMDYLYNSGVFPRILLEQYKARAPIALDPQSGMYFRSELLHETPPSSQWQSAAGIHAYHVEHFKLNWDFMLRKSNSIFAQAMRLAVFGTTEPQTLPSVNWD